MYIERPSLREFIITIPVALFYCICLEIIDMAKSEYLKKTCKKIIQIIFLLIAFILYNGIFFVLVYVLVLFLEKFSEKYLVNNNYMNKFQHLL